jgi:hypothetical protein
MFFFASIVTLLFCAICIGELVLGSWAEADRIQGQETFFAQPLPDEIVHDFCSRGLVPPDLGDCSDKKLQIPLGSVGHIFRANITPTDTKDDINRLFGLYLVDCNEDADAQKSVRCRYNIAGAYVAVNYSSDTGKVLSIHDKND